jgi:hypothetical protein
VREPLPSPPYLSCLPRHCFISPCFLPRCRCVIPPVTVSLAIVGSRCPLVAREGERSNNEARDISQEIFCRTLLAWCYRLAVFGFVVVVVLIIWLSTLVPPRPKCLQRSISPARHIIISYHIPFSITNWDGPSFFLSPMPPSSSYPIALRCLFSLALLQFSFYHRAYRANPCLAVSFSFSSHLG